MPVVAAGRAEDLPQRWEVGGVDDLELGLGHPLEPFRDLADLRALPFGERDDAVVVVGIDDLGAAVAHAGARVEHLGLDDLDAGDVARGIDDLAAVDDRVRNGDEVGSDVAFGRADRDRRHEETPDRVAHVAPERDGVVHRTGVHGAVVAPDVAVAQQTRPALLELRRVRLRVVLQLADVFHRGVLSTLLGSA